MVLSASPGRTRERGNEVRQQTRGENRREPAHLSGTPLSPGWRCEGKGLKGKWRPGEGTGADAALKRCKSCKACLWRVASGPSVAWYTVSETAWRHVVGERGKGPGVWLGPNHDPVS